MAAKKKWIALGYNLPINPSKNRVYVWRKLKDYGVVYFKQGVAVLPNMSFTLNQFMLLSKKIREMGGEASLIELSFVDYNDELELIEKFKEQSQQEYRQLLTDCQILRRELEKAGVSKSYSQSRAEQLLRLKKQFEKVHARDHLKLGLAREVTQRLTELSSLISVP